MNGNNDISNSLPIFDNWIRWRKQTQSLFDFHETLKVVTNGVLELVEIATDDQRVVNKETKKKDDNTTLYISLGLVLPDTNSTLFPKNIIVAQSNCATANTLQQIPLM